MGCNYCPREDEQHGSMDCIAALHSRVAVLHSRAEAAEARVKESERDGARLLKAMFSIRDGDLGPTLAIQAIANEAIITHKPTDASIEMIQKIPLSDQAEATIERVNARIDRVKALESENAALRKVVEAAKRRAAHSCETPDCYAVCQPNEDLIAALSRLDQKGGGDEKA